MTGCRRELEHVTPSHHGSWRLQITSGRRVSWWRSPSGSATSAPCWGMLRQARADGPSSPGTSAEPPLLTAVLGRVWVSGCSVGIDLRGRSPKSGKECLGINSAYPCVDAPRVHDNAIQLVWRADHMPEDDLTRLSVWNLLVQAFRGGAPSLPWHV